MRDQEPAEFDGFEDVVSRMLQARASRHPDHPDPVGITKRQLKAAKHRRRAVVGATATLAVAGGAVFGVAAAYPSDNGSSVSGAVAPDYTGAATCPQNTKVPVDVPRGATETQIAAALVQSGVVKSAQAYLAAAKVVANSGDVIPGTYAICPEISGKNAVLELLKKSNLSDASQITVTPREWSRDVIASLVAKRKWKQADFDAAIANNTIGLPAWSVDSATHQFTVEGMLEPGTYSLTSADTPQSILAQMVANRMEFLKTIDFEDKAATMTCGSGKCTPEQVLNVASIVESQVADQAAGSRVAEAVYRHLEADDPLGIDETALYQIGHLPAGQRPTAYQVQDPNNPYSTYAPHHGLPPTPIDVTSDAMIRAALAPTHENDYYWCTTPTGTKFFTENQKAERDKNCH